MLEVEESSQSTNTYFLYGICCLGILGVISIGILAYFLTKTQQKTTQDNSMTQSNNDLSFHFSGSIYVDINGAVEKPGLYRLSLPIRVADVIHQAGGFVSGADLKYVAEKLDLARKVKDEEKIYIPFKGETLPPFSQQEAGNNDLVSVNAASTDQLQSLPGISKKRADAIIRQRPFTSLDDFRQKSKISIKIFQGIQSLVSL